MKRLFLSTVLVAAALAPAIGADMRQPLAVKTVAPLPYIDPWTGFYFGGAVGYGWNRGDGTGSAATDGGISTSSFATSPQGFVGGLHAGLGTRFGGNFYAGVEAAGGIGTLDGTPQNPGFALNVNSKTNWLVSLSGRVGLILTPNVMAYGKGGWGWAGAQFSATDVTGNTFSTKPVLDGPLLGGGVEWAVTQNWIAGIEYDHFFLGDINASTAGFVGGTPAVFSARVSDNVDAVLGRLSYKFPTAP